MFFLLDAANTVTTATTETSSFLNSELLSALIASCFTLLGVFIGNFSARKTAKSQEQMRLLAEYYAEVFTAFSANAPFSDQRQCLAFISSLEKAWLLCSEESSEIIKELVSLLTKTDPPPKECAELFTRLRESAKKDLRKY